MAKNIPLLFCLLLLSTCGGRVAHPVAINNDYDDRLTCDHLKAEREVNDSRLADLVKEGKHDDLNNAGMAVINPLFLDLHDSERKEADALTKRNAVLDGLIGKKCSGGTANAL